MFFMHRFLFHSFALGWSFFYRHYGCWFVLVWTYRVKKNIVMIFESKKEDIRPNDFLVFFTQCTYNVKLICWQNELVEPKICFLRFCKRYLPVYFNAMIILDYCGNIKMNLKLSSCLLTVVLVSENSANAWFVKLFLTCLFFL